MNELNIAEDEYSTAEETAYQRWLWMQNALRTLRQMEDARRQADPAYYAELDRQRERERLEEIEREKRWAKRRDRECLKYVKNNFGSVQILN